MNFKNNNGSITIFVLVGLLFMSSFLIVSYANNVNRSKIAKEQFNIMSDIYSKGNDEQSYIDAYTDLRNKNKQTMTASSDTGKIELTKTFEDKISNYRIYGNSVQSGTPTPDNPVEVKSVGNKVNLIDIANLEDSEFVDFSEGKIIITNSGEKYTKCEIKRDMLGLSFEEGAKYTISCNVEGEFSGRIYAFFGESLNSSEVVDGKWCKTFTYNQGTDKCKFYILQNHPTENINLKLVSDKLVLSNIQLEKSSEKTEYTPYGKYRIPIKITKENGESIQHNIYLDEPLRAVGQVADYIDFKTGEIVRKTAEYTFSGEEAWLNRSSSLNILGKSRFSVQNVLNKYPKGTFLKAISNMNNIDVIGGVIYDTNYGIQIYNLEDTIVYFTTEEMTLDNFKSWLKDKNAQIIYQLSVEDNSKNLSLPEFNTSEDYTKIEVLTDIAPSKIEVEYTGYTI